MHTSTEAQRQAQALSDYVAAGHHRRKPFGHQFGMDDRLWTELVRGWIEPALAAKDGAPIDALEIGVGGGRWTRHYAERVRLAWLVDATPAAQEAVLAHLAGPFHFLVSADGSLPEIPDSSVEWCWSFDTFVHFHPALFERYAAEIARVLRPGGVLHLHYAVAWPGLQHNAGCFQYREPDEVARLLEGLGLPATGRALDMRHGYGSRLAEFHRVLCPE